MTPQITNADASRNITTFAKEGRLKQKAWHGKSKGVEVACLLGAMHQDGVRDVTHPTLTERALTVAAVTGAAWLIWALLVVTP